MVALAPAPTPTAQAPTPAPTSTPPEPTPTWSPLPTAAPHPTATPTPTATPSPTPTSFNAALSWTAREVSEGTAEQLHEVSLTVSGLPPGSTARIDLTTSDLRLINSEHCLIATDQLSGSCELTGDGTVLLKVMPESADATLHAVVSSSAGPDADPTDDSAAIAIPPRY